MGAAAAGKALKGASGRVLATDAVVFREIQRQAEAHGTSALSIRQLAEETGVTHKTVNRSLGRLASAGQIVKVGRAYGNRPTRWLIAEPVRTDGRSTGSERMTPRDGGGGTPDLFRRRDLSGPGALYVELPQAGFFSAEEVLLATMLTSNIRTVELWLMVLGSQLWPMVEEVAVGDDGPVLWRKLHLSEAELQANADYLIGRAATAGRRSLKTRAQTQRQHQQERMVATYRSAVPRGN